MQRQQVEGLEFLRGFCAIAVAMFHCLEWGGVTEMYGWGLYGVYIFFVISGAVLYYSYRTLTDIPGFLLRRFARLAPMYFLALAITTLGLHLVVGPSHFLNASLLFGFASPGATSLVAGGWSLGIEFALYALFPMLLAFTTSNRVALLTLACLFGLRVTTAEITVVGTMEHWWPAYTQLGSFLFFFFGGMVVARLMEQPQRYPIWPLGIIAAAVIFGSPMHEPVLTGLRAAVYAALCLPLVAWFFRVKLPLSRFLGEISYGLYLLHPIVWGLLHRFLDVPLKWRVILTIPCTAAIAWLALRIYEQPAKRLILRLGSRVINVRHLPNAQLPG